MRGVCYHPPSFRADPSTERAVREPGGDAGACPAPGSGTGDRGSRGPDPPPLQLAPVLVYSLQLRAELWQSAAQPVLTFPDLASTPQPRSAARLPLLGSRLFRLHLPKGAFHYNWLVSAAGGPWVGGLWCPQWGWRGEKLTPGQRNGSAVLEHVQRPRLKGRTGTGDCQVLIPLTHGHYAEPFAAGDAASNPLPKLFSAPHPPNGYLKSSAGRTSNPRAGYRAVSFTSSAYFHLWSQRNGVPKPRRCGQVRQPQFGPFPAVSRGPCPRTGTTPAQPLHPRAQRPVATWCLLFCLQTTAGRAEVF